MEFHVQLIQSGWKSKESARGRVHWRGHPDSLELLEAALVSALDSQATNTFERIAGHWCAVLETPTGYVLAQDRIRSWPLFVAAGRNDSTLITDEIANARTFTGPQGRNEDSAIEFLNLGYVAGGDTLFPGITQIQAGEWRRLSKSRQGDISVILPSIMHRAPGIHHERELDARFTESLDTAFDRLFNRIGNRQVVIPLSGGLDSRLLAIAMHDRGHRNVLNFTYGVGKTNEVAISEEVASKLGQPWVFIQYTPEEIREAWAQPAAGEFIRNSYAGASLPHIQDWYAVGKLRESGAISEDAVFLAGHTIVGNMHDESILFRTDEVSTPEIVELLVQHHATIQPSAKDLIGSPRFIRKLEELLLRVGYDGTPNERLNAIEYWNVIERQTKYINHSMRTYEHFGYEWALPMLDLELFDCWNSFDLSIAQDREWYRRYVDRRYAAITGDKIATFEAFAAANVSQSNRDRLKSVLRALGVLQRIEREITARAVSSHPMALQAFVGPTTPQELNRFVRRGGSPMGIYARRFLDDTWNPHTNLFSEQLSQELLAGKTNSLLRNPR